MKSAKKILLLVLSLMMLIGVFAVWALADEAPTAATVVYPDGREETVAVGTAITPPTFKVDGTTSLYEGLGNTLYKDDATEGWIFTVEGQSTALTDLTVTADMAGKKIIASGVQKVYYTLAKYTGDFNGANSSSIVRSSIVYSTTNNAHETLTGSKSKTTIMILYEDVNASSFTFATDSSGYFGVLDLNGHTVRVSNSLKVYYIKGFIYSSQPGAHFYSTASVFAYDGGSGTATFGDDGTGNFVNNITFHCKVISKKMDSGGLTINGGHWYQTASGVGFLDLSGCVNVIKKATFYLASGSQALFASDATFKGSSAKHGNIAKGTNAISGCTFYSPSTVPALYSTTGATVKFTNCNFYGITAENSGSDGTVTALDKNNPEVEGGTNTFGDAITYQSVTWLDGTKDYYYATTEEEALTIVQELPKYKDRFDPYLIGADGDYKVSVSPIPEINLDAETLCAVVIDRSEEFATPYFSVAVTNGATTYYTNKSTASTDFVNYMKKMNNAGSKITLYADISVAGFKTIGGGSHGLDLNGYTLTFTSGVDGKMALDGAAKALYIYSTRAGGVIDASVATSLMRANDDAASATGTKIYGHTYLGERNSTDASNGKNLTVYCKQICEYMYGDGLTIYGGTYIQSKNSNASYFLLVGGRESSNETSYVQNVKNTTFILTNSATKPLHLRVGADRTFTNCTFISPAITGVALSAYTAYPKTYTFTNCNFVNVRPEINAKIVYSGTTSYGTGDQTFFSTEDFDPAEESAQYLVHDTTAKTITADGVTYTLDGKLVTSLDNALKITFEKFEDYGEYWMKDTSPVKSGKGFFIVDQANEKYYARACYDYSQISQMTNGKVTAAGEATAPLVYIEEELAFTYLDVKTSVLYGAGYTSDCGETEEGVFAKFYELFSVPASQYNITMYKNMTVNKGMAFGKLCKYTDSKGANRDYYYSLAQGSMIWDINGTTVTISKNTTGFINLNAANSGGTFNTVFGLEGGDANYGGGNVTSKLTVKSSKEGGRFINNSSAYLFGVAEGSNPQYSIQGAIYEGDTLLKSTLTVESASPIYYGHNSSNGKKHLEIIGGTYIYTGTGQPFSFSGGAERIKDATIICTKSISKVFGFDKYRQNVITVENCIIVTLNAAPLFGGNSSDGGDFTSGTGSSAKVIDCKLIGPKPSASLHATKTSPVTYEGENFASSEAYLQTMYGDAAEGKAAAYLSILANGESYKTMGLYENVPTNFVTVENLATDITEVWLVGATYLIEGNLPGASTVEVDGVWYYRPNPVWAYTVNGTAVADPCDSANGGKTVQVTVGGELAALYFVIEETATKEITYYYGDRAENEAAFKQIFVSMPKTAFTLKLYANMTTELVGTVSTKGASSGTVYNFDLNGFAWTVNVTPKAGTSTPQHAFQFNSGTYNFYSSVEGGEWILSGTVTSLLMVNDNVSVSLAAKKDATDTSYAKYFTVKCNKLNDYAFWGSGLHIYGGTYIQNSEKAENFFINLENGRLNRLDNATFIMNNANALFYTCKYSDTSMDNITVISAKPMNLYTAPSAATSTAYTFKNGYFYNVKVNAAANTTFTNCNFNLCSSVKQNNGYVAYTGETVEKTVLGKTYTFTAKVVSEANVGIVDWGFGLVEYWEAGATATHANVIVDGVFGYTFTSLTVVVGNQTAEKTLAAMKPGVLGMSLTLQSSIGLNLQISEALENITAVTIGGQSFELVEAEDGKYWYTKFVSPDKANGIVIVAITVGSNVHEIPVSVGSYARTILGSAKYEAAHNLTYAMVEYVRVMANDASFLSDVAAPAGYEVQTLEAVQSNNNGTILSAIRFNLSGTIAIEIEGENGKDVNLILATTRSEHSTIAGGTAMFAGLYVNEFYGEMTIRVDGEVYKYSLANYLFGVKDNADAAEAVQALYNYTYHADAYADALLNAGN